MTVLVGVVVGIPMVARGLVNLLYLSTDTPEFTSRRVLAAVRFVST